MSVKVLSQVWEYSKASGTPLLVLLCLADYANDEGECWPSIDSIRRKCRLKDDRHVKRLIRDELERDLGEVVVIRNAGQSSSKGGLRSNKYRITVHMPEEPIVVHQPPSERADSGSPTTQMVAEQPPPIVVHQPPEPSGEASLNQPPNPLAVDNSRRRRGTRGSGTSSRELRRKATVRESAQRVEDELDRLVTAIPETYANHPDVAEAKIRETFTSDPDRCRRSLEHLKSLGEAS